jgi:hypothetical protein
MTRRTVAETCPDTQAIEEAAQLIELRWGRSRQAKLRALPARLRAAAARLEAALSDPPSPCADCASNDGPSSYGGGYVICLAAGGVSHDPRAGCGAYHERGPAGQPRRSCTDCATYHNPCTPLDESEPCVAFVARAAPATAGQERCPGCVHASSRTDEPPCFDCHGQNFTKRQEEPAHG